MLMIPDLSTLVIPDLSTLGKWTLLRRSSGSFQQLHVLHRSPPIIAILITLERSLTSSQHRGFFSPEADEQTFASWSVLPGYPKQPLVGAAAKTRAGAMKMSKELRGDQE